MRIVVRGILCVAAAAAGIGPVSARLVSGPVVGHATDTSASLWAYAGSGKGVSLEYGPVGAPAAALTRIAAPPRADRNHTSLAVMKGLKASTPYRYRVLVDGVQAYEGQFTTAPSAHRPARFSYFAASCMDYSQTAYQRAWDAVAAQKPDLNLLIGDNVYADNTDYGVLWNKHMSQRSIPNFARLLAGAPTYATWDDHDFGPNDSHGATPGKENSLRAFKDLWPNPSFGTPQLPGVFFAYHWANVHFIFMDSRYHRTAEDAPHSATKSMFGDAQLEWLFQQLKASRSPFKVVVSSYDIMSGKFPNDIRRIARFVLDNRIYGVIFNSGDIHRNDFRRQDHQMGYPVTQITSSGITRVINRPWVMIEANTTLPDPALSARFFTQEKLDSTVVVKLSALTPAGARDLIVAHPVGGEELVAGSRVAIEWTRVGTGIDRVDLDYSLGSQWIPIARAVPNSGSYGWTLPAVASATAKVRVSDPAGTVRGESPGVFRILGASGIAERRGGESISVRLPGGRAFPLEVPPGTESVRAFDLQGTLLLEMPVRRGLATGADPGREEAGQAGRLLILQPILPDGRGGPAIPKALF